MKSYPQNNDYAAGSWKGLLLEDEITRKASFTCPTCGQTGTLRSHEIANDGTVTPSVVCSYECGFHEYIKLEGWKG